jgi:hypothetical protein
VEEDEDEDATKLNTIVSADEVAKALAAKLRSFDGAMSSANATEMNAVDEGITHTSDRIALKVLQIQEKVCCCCVAV